MAEKVKHTVIESGTEFDGSMKSDCPITLSGILKGQVTAPSLDVTQSGAVKGKVKVSQLTSQGEVSGEVEAETVELSGRVSDETVIKAKTLEVKLTQATGGLQMTFGNCQLDVGQLPQRPKTETTGQASSETGGQKKQHQQTAKVAEAKPSEAKAGEGKKAGDENFADAVADLIS